MQKINCISSEPTFSGVKLLGGLKNLFYNDHVKLDNKILSDCKWLCKIVPDTSH